MSEFSQKPCKRCYEPIPLAAQRCPKCQSWQSIGACLAGNAHGWTTLPFLLLAFVPIWWLWNRGGTDFAKYQDQIEVVNVELRTGERGTHDGLVTVGWLRNHSRIKWNDVVIEVQYFDKDGKLIGANSQKDYGLVLLPGGEHAFQVTTQQPLPSESYASQKVYVRDAREANKWP